jgi:tRNA-binding protein
MRQTQAGTLEVGITMSDTHEQPERAAEITIEDFEKVDIRVGRVLSAEPLEGARKPAYKLRIDFGPDIGIKQSSAQLTALYRAEDLVGRLVMGVVNFPPRRIAGFRSEVLTLGVADPDGAVILLAPDHDAPLGARMF